MSNSIKTYGERECINCDPEKECPDAVIGITDSCFTAIDINPTDSYPEAMKKIACKIVSMQSTISTQTNLINTLSSAVNNFKNDCCSKIKTYSHTCAPGQGLKLSQFEKSTDGGTTYVVQPLQGTILDTNKMKALGIETFVADSRVLMIWTESDSLKYKITVQCDGEPVVESDKFNWFAEPVCQAGYKPFVTVYKIDGVPQLFDGEWTQAFRDQLISQGWKKSGALWGINSTKKYEITLECVAKTATLQNFVIDCNPGCEFRIPAAGLTRNGSPMNNTPLTYPTLTAMLLYLKSVDSLWTLSGSTLSITSPDTWGLTVNCVNCTVQNGTCEICATYSGGNVGASLDVYYTLNGGLLQLVSLESGNCFSTAGSNSVKIISLFPQNSVIADWTIVPTMCDMVPGDEASISPTVAYFTEGEEACNGTIRGQVEVSGMGINSTNDGLLPGNSIVVKVDGVTQVKGDQYTLTFSAGVVTIDSLTPWDGLGAGLLSTQPGGSCPGGYANDNTHLVEIFVTNGVGSTASYTEAITF